MPPYNGPDGNPRQLNEAHMEINDRETFDSEVLPSDFSRGFLQEENVAHRLAAQLALAVDGQVNIPQYRQLYDQDTPSSHGTLQEIKERVLQLKLPFKRIVSQDMKTVAIMTEPDINPEEDSNIRSILATQDQLYILSVDSTQTNQDNALDALLSLSQKLSTKYPLVYSDGTAVPTSDFSDNWLKRRRDRNVEVELGSIPDIQVAVIDFSNAALKDIYTTMMRRLKESKQEPEMPAVIHGMDSIDI